MVDCVYDSATSELFLVSGDHGGNVNVLNVGANHHVQHCAALKGGHKACVRSLYFDGDALFTGGEDARLGTWTSGAMAGASAAAASPSLSLKASGAHDVAGMKKARKSSRPY